MPVAAMGVKGNSIFVTPLSSLEGWKPFPGISKVSKTYDFYPDLSIEAIDNSSSPEGAAGPLPFPKISKNSLPGPRLSKKISVILTSTPQNPHFCLHSRKSCGNIHFGSLVGGKHDFACCSTRGRQL
jgi:hypothetical protein